MKQILTNNILALWEWTASFGCANEAIFKLKKFLILGQNPSFWQHWGPGLCVHDIRVCKQ